MTSMSSEGHQQQDVARLVKQEDSVTSLSLPTTDVNENHVNGGSAQTSPISTQSDLSHSGMMTGISQPHDNFSSAVAERSVTNNSCTSRSRKRGDHIKRPMNAFLIWSTRRRHEIKEGEQQITMAEISKRLGQEWKDMTIEERQPFIDQAKQIRADHMTKYPDYKYQPRRKKTSGVVSKVKSSGGVSENSSAISVSNANVDIPVSSSHGQLNATQISGTNAGQGVIYQSASTQLLANSITPPQQLQFQAQRDNDQQNEQPLQIGANTPLSQSQQVIVTTPCLMPPTGNQTGYTVILPSNHNNGLPIYLRAVPQQQSQNPQPQTIMQPQFLTSQTGAVAQPPLQASPQLQAAVQPQQNQLPNLQTSLQPQLIPAGSILMSGGALQSIQPLTEGQVPFSQM